MKLVECVPNFSEGRRPEVVREIADAIAGVAGAELLDVSSDASHNRSVVTFVAPLESAVAAAFAGIRKALDLIDLNEHSGEHPRIGAADVVPFVPMQDTTMDDCVALAEQLGERVGRELEIPVYLYERAARRPERANLAAIRRGNFEMLRSALGRDPERDPDFGPARIHATFGAVAIGARPVLVAYNVYLRGESDLPLARQIAKSVRESSGGLPAVKAMGLLVDAQAQVSMNLVDIDRTPIHVAFDAVSKAALANGSEVSWSEIVGLVPERALNATAAAHLKLDRFSHTQILERRVQEAMQREQSVRGLLAELASSQPSPGGGTAAAHAGAVAASLVQMVAALTVGRKKYAAVDPEMRSMLEEAESLARQLSMLAEKDAQAYSVVSKAYRLPRDNESSSAERRRAIDAALTTAAEVPLETAEACARVAELAAAAASRGNSNAVSDAAVAALLAAAACRGALFNVGINVAALSDPSSGRALAEAAGAFSEHASQLADAARVEVERAISQR